MKRNKIFNFAQFGITIKVFNIDQENNMKKSVNFLNEKIRINEKGMLSATDLQKFLDEFCKKNGSKRIYLASFMKSFKFKCFKIEVENDVVGDVIETTVGRHGSTWVHLLVFIYMITNVNTDLCIDAYEWVITNVEMKKQPNSSIYMQLKK